MTRLGSPMRRASRRPIIRLLALFAVIAAAGAVALALRAHRSPSPDLRKMAVADLQQLAKRDHSVPVLGALFERTVRSGDVKEAAGIAGELVKRYPRDARAHNAMGVALASQIMPDEAKREFNVAIALDPRGIDPYVNLGRLALKQEDYARARIEFDRATSVDPKSANAWHGMADACKELGERDAASNAFEQALTLAPNDMRTLTDIGTFEAEMGHGTQARPRLLKALQGGYRSGGLYAALTMAFADQPQSREDLSTALKYAAEAEKVGD